MRLIGVGLSNFVADAVQLSLEPGPSQKSESLSAAMDRVRTKYGSRSLQTGRTAFDKSLRDRDHDHVFDRNTGLSSQIG